MLENAFYCACTMEVKGLNGLLSQTEVVMILPENLTLQKPEKSVGQTTPPYNWDKKRSAGTPNSS